MVTGGASGLGAATSLALLNGGGKVVIYDLPRQEADAKPLVDLGATFLGIDVINEADVKRCVAKTVAVRTAAPGTERARPSANVRPRGPLLWSVSGARCTPLTSFDVCAGP